MEILNKLKIQTATFEDLNEINEIFNYYVLNTLFSFQTIPETIENRTIWFKNHGDKYPIFVALYENIVVGWVSLSKYNQRQSYFPTVELSIYIHHNYLNIGIGRSLMDYIIKIANELHYHSIISVIASNQIASIGLHQKFGFIEVGKLKEVGYKFENWLDITIMQKIL